MDTFKKNSFVKWSSADAEGKFSHIGKVAKHQDGIIEFANGTGVFGVPEDEGTFKAIAKPKTWSTAAPERLTTPIAIKKQPGIGSKFAQVMELMSECKPRTRKEALCIIAERELMTPAGASTYIAKANKELRLW